MLYLSNKRLKNGPPQGGLNFLIVICYAVSFETAFLFIVTNTNRDMSTYNKNKNVMIGMLHIKKRKAIPI